MKKRLKFKVWAVTCGKKLCIVRATKDSAWGHWADLTNAFDKDYQVVSGELSLPLPSKQRRKAAK